MGLPQILITIVLIILIIYGLISIFSPRTAWWLSLGWQLKNSEPSHAALIANRVGGVFMVIVAAIMIYWVVNGIL
ncbi:DUF6199 family natural product biosynthesis protein [Oceanobacillus neutriphilus]|uniref:DUF6199 domain-containing protein n=1 Tax=Oceanobacillus neutriphilus TaxID=531815 RepID=A0ABQ2NUB5_9BACI|nr:DUF6199 family natural product biosynthesis protein [Oceanobacillus neutriphilus]GGP10701.1 hypothetical protein GCM10011346_19880 [Oceanobacillus neutriphilus]